MVVLLLLSMLMSGSLFEGGLAGGGEVSEDPAELTESRP